MTTEFRTNQQPGHKPENNGQRRGLRRSLRPGLHRGVRQLINGVATRDGAGVRLTRLIGSSQLEMLDPFLLLDHFESDDPDDYIAGFPTHPHRGFETVTYLLKGRMRHKDSAGHEGVIDAGGVQWMTAGRGIQHSEMPEQQEGELSGFQLWVNLPAAKKMTTPAYQEFSAGQMTQLNLTGGGKVRVIAGAVKAENGEQVLGPVRDIVTQPVYLDVQLNPGESFQHNLPAAHNAFIYLIAGSLDILADQGVRHIDQKRLAVLTQGDEVDIHAKAQGARFLLVAGRPLNEPVARYGPFVMNNRDEIYQAINDFNAGRF